MGKFFKRESLALKNAPVIYFTDFTGPQWLMFYIPLKGPIKKADWFWKNRILKLKVGESVESNFHKITRVKRSECVGHLILEALSDEFKV